MSVQASTVLASALRTGTTNSSSINVPDWTPADPRSLTIVMDVTAATALTGLTAEVQWSVDGTVWAAVDGTKDITVTVITGVTTICKQVPVKAPYYRVQAIVTGTNATFSVKAAYQA